MNSANIDEFKSYKCYDEVETEIVNEYMEEAIKTTNAMSQNLVEENHSTNAINETMKYFRTVAFMKKENKCDDDCRCCLRYDQLKCYIIDFVKGFMNHDIKKFEQIGLLLVNLEEEQKPENLSKKQ